MKSLVRMILLLVLLYGASQSAYSQQCQGGLGGRFFDTGGVVSVEVLSNEADFTSAIRLFMPRPSQPVASSDAVGTVVSLGTFTEGTELVFGIVVQDTGEVFRMGPGSRNPDGVPHAIVTCLGSGEAIVGFEDKSNSDDLDYDDVRFHIRTAAIPPRQVYKAPFSYSDCNFTTKANDARVNVRNTPDTGRVFVDVFATSIGSAFGRAGLGVVYLPTYTGRVKVKAFVRLRLNSLDLLTRLSTPSILLSRTPLRGIAKLVDATTVVSIDSDVFVRATSNQPLAVGTNRFRSDVESVLPEDLADWALLTLPEFFELLNFYELRRYNGEIYSAEFETSVTNGQPLNICAGVQSRVTSIAPFRFIQTSGKGLYYGEVVQIVVTPK